MSRTDLSGPIVAGSAGFATPDVAGISGAFSVLCGQITGIVENTATTILTVTVPNINCGAGGTVLCCSTLTQASHIGDSTRTVLYIWSVTRLAGAVAVITISLVTGGSAIATKGSGYTFTSVIAATSVSGSATQPNTFSLQVTNDASTDSTSMATFRVELLNNLGAVAAGTASVPAPGVTLS